MFKLWLDKVLSNLIWLLLGRRMALRPPEVPPALDKGLFCQSLVLDA